MASRFFCSASERRLESHFANSDAMLAKAFTSTALPDGSRKNIVAWLADFALEANMRLDDETRAGRLQLVRERFPLRDGQHHAEVAHGHGVAIDRARRPMTDFVRRKVRHDLMPVEIEIHPVFRTASFRAAEQFAIERARIRKTVNGKREMKRRHGVVRGVHGRRSVRVDREKPLVYS